MHTRIRVFCAVCVAFCLTLPCLPALCLSAEATGEAAGTPPATAKSAENTQSSLPKTFTNSIGMEFVLIPAGSFVMGCAADEKDCETEATPPHKVVITKPFYLGKYEVTQAQWEAIMGRHYSRKGRDNPLPKAIRGADMPVIHVSW